MLGMPSSFDRNEVFVPRGVSVDSFLPLLLNNNEGEKPPIVQCGLCSVAYLRTVIAPMLFPAHWAEVAEDPNWAVDPHWEYYQALENNNSLRIVGLWVGATPVGYFIFTIGPSLHYRTKLVAASVLVYITPSYRARYALRLFRAAERFAKLAGAGKIYITSKTSKDISPLTRRLGFQPVEDVVVKTLE